MADSTGFSINLNEKSTILADIKVSNNTIQLEALGLEDSAAYFYSSDNESIVEKEAEIISRLHTNLRIKKREATIVIPDINTFSRIIEMPRLKEKELLAAIRYQADEFIPMNIDETNLDLEILKEDPVANKVLLFIVASPKKLVEKIQKTIELADLVPVTLENELSAVARLVSTFMKKSGEKSGTTILINFGYSSTSLYLFDETSSILLLNRSFKVGLGLFIKDIVANLNTDETKAVQLLKNMGADANASLNLNTIIDPIAREITREIERFILISKEKYGLPVSELYSFNFDTSIAGFNQKLQSSLSVPISSLTISNHIAETPLKKSFSTTLSSFISVIAGGI